MKVQTELAVQENPSEPTGAETTEMPCSNSKSFSDKRRGSFNYGRSSRFSRDPDSKNNFSERRGSPERKGADAPEAAGDAGSKS